MPLRITGGTLKGKNIEILLKKGIRYTSSKVRESVFNILGDVSGRRLLELYAGSGIFSFEAISRGVEYVTMVEKEKEMLRLIKKNATNLSVMDKCEIMELDVFRAVPVLHRRGSKYDIIFLDPPYQMGYVDRTLGALERYPVYSEECVVIVEHSKREAVRFQVEDEVILRKYGDTYLTIIKKGKN